MAWEDKTLKKNAQNEIVPQAFNDVIDDYEPVKSTDGALHNVLYGPNGLPLKAINDKLEVRSTELEALVQGLASEGKLEQTRALVDTLSTKVDELNTKVDALTEDGSLKVQQSGTIVVNTVGDLPPSGHMAQVALVKEGQRVFIFDGSEWGEW